MISLKGYLIHNFFLLQGHNWLQSPIYGNSTCLPIKPSISRRNCLFCLFFLLLSSQMHIPTNKVLCYSSIFSFLRKMMLFGCRNSFRMNLEIEMMLEVSASLSNTPILHLELKYTQEVRWGRKLVDKQVASPLHAFLCPPLPTQTQGGLAVENRKQRLGVNRNNSTGLVLQQYNSHSCYQLPSFHGSRDQLTAFSEKNSRSVELILVERGGPISN